MLFSSMIFLILFLPIILVGYYILFRKSRMVQNIWLLLGSLIFYAWGEPKFVLIMLASIFCNWIFGLAIDKHRVNNIAKVVLIVMLAYNLGILFVFKYMNFTTGITNHLFGIPAQVTDIALPIGISFFSFQAISYVLDVYLGKAKVQKNLLKHGLYISFFPQLIAGPIVRYETIADQIDNRKESWEEFTHGIYRFMVGFCKKVLLANNLALIADASFAKSPQDLSVAFAWLGAIAYTLQIYFDFSGYSDMAIGLGEMFGFHFLENFNYPYISDSVSEFWRRWHISLSTFFKEYVYIPLGGNRVKTKYRLIFNIFVVWLLTGIWYGANWTFIAWGLFYFVFLIMEKMIGFEKKNIPGAVKHIYTLLIVNFGWVLFRADSISNAWNYVKCMLGMNGNNMLCGDFYLFLLQNLTFLICALIAGIPWLKILPKRLVNSDIFYGIRITILFVLFFFSISFIVKGAYNPFIYFNF